MRGTSWGRGAEQKGPAFSVSSLPQGSGLRPPCTPFLSLSCRLAVWPQLLRAQTRVSTVPAAEGAAAEGAASGGVSKQGPGDPGGTSQGREGNSSASPASLGALPPGGPGF